MSTAISFVRHAWIPSVAVADDSRCGIENVLCNDEGIFSSQMDRAMGELFRKGLQQRTYSTSFETISSIPMVILIAAHNLSVTVFLSPNLNPKKDHHKSELTCWHMMMMIKIKNRHKNKKSDCF